MRRSHNWDNNYKGLTVPNGHGSIFRGMDEDARLQQLCTASIEASRRKEASSAAQAACNELSKIREKHSIVYNQIVLDALKDLIDDIDIQQVIFSRSPVVVTNHCQLGQSNKFNSIKKHVPDLLNEYIRTWTEISQPFYNMTQTLLKCKTTYEVQAKKSLFLSQMNYLEPYFDYPDGTNGKLTTSQIVTKQTLLDIANSISDQATECFAQQERLRVEAEERLRVEAEERLRAEAEERLRVEAEERLRVEAEERLRVEAEERAAQEDDLLAELQQLKAALKAKDNIIGQQAGQLNQQAEKIDHLNERLELSQKHNQEIAQDKSELREHVSDLRESNLEKADKLKKCDEVIARQKSEYDFLKDQFDSIVNQEIPDNPEDVVSLLSGAISSSSIGSFEVINNVQ